MSKKITYINQDNHINTDYNIIIEDDNGNKTLAKLDIELEKLLNQEELVKNIKAEKQKVYNETKANEDIIKYRKIDIFGSFISPISPIIFSKIILDLLFGNMTFYLPRFDTEVVYSTFITSCTAVVAISAGIVSIIYNKYKLDKAKDKQNSLEAQCKYLNEVEEKETAKLEKIRQNANFEKNSIQLKTETISPKEELQKLKDELTFYYNQGYYTENSNTNNTNIEENNKQFVKTM